MKIIHKKRLTEKLGLGAIVFVALIAGVVGVGTIESTIYASTNVLEAENLSLASWAGGQYADPTASNGTGLLVWTNASAAGSIATGGTTGTLTVRARADLCSGSPIMNVILDNTMLESVQVDAISWTDYNVPLTTTMGTHSLKISFTNDYKGDGCDRNLRLDRVTATMDPPAVVATSVVANASVAPSSSAPASSLGDVKLDVDPSTPAKAQEDQWRAVGYTDGANTIDKIASQPVATWFGGWSGDIRAAVSARVNAAASRGGMATLVAYNIPDRDCGGYSSGGTDAAGYKTWIGNFAAGLGNKGAIVILEPDAIDLTSCLSDSDKQTRFDLLRYAGQTLTAAGATVYLDAGHSGWQSTDDVASELQAAGVANDRGFSLNVSNFGSTSAQAAYANAIRAKIGQNKTYVVDTSRNGTATAGTQWCNPWGQGLGMKPTTQTGVSGADAYLWIKAPGESDGSCNGGPAAGQFWLDYAMALARGAAF